VSDCLARAHLAGLSWPLPKDLDDAALEAKLYPPPTPSGEARALLDFKYIHRELRRKGVTLQLLWDEYKADHPDDGYQYSRYCELYRLFRRQLPVVMHQEHKAGEKTFVDFSGDGIDIVDRETGEVTEAPVFVAVLGASSYTYAEAFESEQLRCWLDGQTHAFEYYGGVTFHPDKTVSGCARNSAVTHAPSELPSLMRSHPGSMHQTCMRARWGDEAFFAWRCKTWSA